MPDGLLVAYAGFAFATASAFYSAVVWFGNHHLSQEAKDNLTLWLWGEYESTWSHHFCNLFDAVFGKRHLSFKCFLRSSIASVLTVLLLYVVFAEILGVMECGDSGEDGKVGEECRISGKLSVWQALILGAAINVIPDYLSLYETRWLLKRFERVKSALGQVAVLLADAVFTGAIIWISISVFQLIEGDFQLIEGEAQLSAVEMLAVFSVFSVFFYSTFATSVWAWIYCLSTWFMRLFARGSLGKILDVERKPTTQVALVGATIIFAVSLAFLPAFSTDVEGRASVFDETLCSWFGGGVCLQIARYTGDDEQAFDIMSQYCESVSDAKCGVEVSGYFQGSDDKAAEIWRKSCVGGYARGCRAIGWMHDHGKGVEENDATAVDFYRDACDGGDPGGCSNLGLMYQSGRGVELDENKALLSFQKACPAGEVNAEGCSNLGWMYEDGRGVKQDFEKAAELYRRACDGSEARGCSNLGWMYQEGRGVDKDDEEAVYYYRKACPEGEGEVDARGCSNLGWMHEDGRGVKKKDPAKAVELYRKACDRGHAEGCGNLGVMYREGRGVERDYEMAVQYSRKACPAGEGEVDARGCSSLGWMYEHGKGVEQEFKDVEQRLKTAVGLYRKACDHGHAEGCGNLGVMYENGKGVEQEFKDTEQRRKTAVDLYRKACEGEHAKGCTELGRMYFHGLGVREDETRAVALFRQACDGKDATGCFNLGQFYERGFVVERDPAKAAMLFQKARELEHE